MIFERALINICSQFIYDRAYPNVVCFAVSKSYKAKFPDGSCVECGVWRGWNLALMSKYSENLGLKKSIIGFDTFEGMPKAEEIDKDFLNNSANEIMRNSVKDERIPNIHCYASL